METQLIISLGREFGSGGHAIAEILAQHYNLPLYDYNLLRDIAIERNLDADELEQYDENPKNLFFTRTIRGFNNSPEENIARLQFDFIKKKADTGESFIIVGRCAENILKNNANLISIFVVGDTEQKINRIMERNSISYDKAKKMIDLHDRKRKTYHNHFCQGKWGDSRNYDLSINSSKLGISETANILVNYIDVRLKLK